MVNHVHLFVFHSQVAEGELEKVLSTSMGDSIYTSIRREMLNRYRCTDLLCMHVGHGKIELN